MANQEAVAIVAVHGVADQAPGATAQSVVDLLVSSVPGGAYRAVASDDITLQTRPLRQAASGGATHGAARAAAPRARSRSFGLALAQSFGSDFHRRDAAGPRDRGIALTGYLLGRQADENAQPEVYTTRRLVLERAAAAPDGAPLRVDVHEMYWADLSRLSGAMPRIVSEVFTMVFRLSKLGRETVEEMRATLRATRDAEDPASRRRAAAWTVTSLLQRTLDWMIVNLLALLFMQLALLAAFFVAMGTIHAQVTLALGEPAMRLVHLGVAGAVVAGALLRLLYLLLPRPRTFGPQALATLAVAVAVALLAWRVPGAPPWLSAGLLLGLLTLANQKLLRIADDRFPFVHLAGTVLWIASLVAMLWSAFDDARAHPAIDWNSQWIHAAMFVTEAVLMLVKWWWIAAAGVLLVWVIAGLICAREGGYAGAASIATGRLGVAISLSMFVAVTICTWTALAGVLSWSVQGTGYTPCLFGIAPTSQVPRVRTDLVGNDCPLLTADAASRAGLLAAARPGIPVSEDVLADRYTKSSESFSLLTTLLVLLLLYLAAMFVPSVLAELKLLIARGRNGRRRPPVGEPARRTRALGAWLTFGYRWFDGFLAAFTLLGIAMCCAVGYVFVGSYFDWLPQPTAAHAVLARLSTTLLAPLILGAGSLGAALTLFGGMLSRTVPPLRAPLDVAMDVDNHFREFPRANIPRARIFSRYAALLAHLRAQGYGRIVVVAHSQGTVISAELLRFLSSRDGCAPERGQTPCLDGKALPPIDLLTVGCPLRQLYAARFPSLYAWVLARHGQSFGPRAGDVGVGRWFNGFCSGDYVGRWLWSDAVGADALPHPMDAPLANRPFGRADVYADFEPSPPTDDEALARAREVEVCLGLGAHTHYFESGQTLVAWLIDHLVRSGAPRPPPSAAPAEVLEATLRV